jgi:hypothetical protein
MINSDGQYDQMLSRQYPGLFVILLDQSASMGQMVASANDTKANIATMHVNTIIQAMVDLAGADEFDYGTRKKYAYLSVLGYNDVVYPLLAKDDIPIDIPTLADNPRGVVPVERLLRNAEGAVIRKIVEEHTYWIEPRFTGNTQMVAALDRAKVIVENWLKAKPEFISDDLGWQQPRSRCFPPVVINITDAQHNGRGNTVLAAEELRSMGTTNGNTLLFNCHFTHENNHNPCVFPKDISEVKRLDKYGLAANMFRMSSVIPESLRQKASKIMRIPIQPGARCFVYNANPTILLNFLRWGTIRVVLSAATGAS